MKIVGIKHSTIKFKDGNQVTGYNLFLSEPREGVQGVATESVFVSDQRIAPYSPVLGDNVRIYYNRWGKVESVMKYAEK